MSLGEVGLLRDGGRGVIPRSVFTARRRWLSWQEGGRLLRQLWRQSGLRPLV